MDDQERMLSLGKLPIGNKLTMIDSLQGLLVVRPDCIEDPPSVVLVSYPEGGGNSDFFMGSAMQQMSIDGAIPALAGIRMRNECLVRMSALPEDVQKAVWDALLEKHLRDRNPPEVEDPPHIRARREMNACDCQDCRSRRAEETMLDDLHDSRPCVNAPPKPDSSDRPMFLAGTKLFG